jgi:uncharacterized protein (TIGR00296 family)
MLSLSEGRELVKLARKTVEDYLKNGKPKIKETEFKEKRGIFVSIHTFPDHLLRGCIGYPYPVLRLGEVVQRASISAAFKDPRFPPLTEDELKKIIFEVSVLTLPKLIRVKDPGEYPKKIKASEDGLIIEYGSYNGLLLPQVWEKIPDKEEFLATLCWKAGLTPDYWKGRDTKIYRFEVQAFAEKEPNGKVIQTSH